MKTDLFSGSAVRCLISACVALSALGTTTAWAGVSLHDADHEHAESKATTSSKSSRNGSSTPTITEESMPLDPRFSPERIKADVTFLADDLLEGRDTASRGHEIAARFAAQRFASLGLQPGGDVVDGKRTWFQQVKLQKTSGVTDATFELTGPDGKVTAFKHGDDVLVGRSETRLSYDISAPVVFAGYGLTDKTLRLDDYAGLDVAGKIVLVLAGIPEGLPSEPGAYLSESKSRNAVAHGAIGVITLGTDAYLKRRSWAGSIRSAQASSYAWVGPDGKAHDDTPGMIGSARVNGAAAEALFAGSGRTAKQVLAQAAKKGSMPKGFALKTSVRLASKATAQTVTSPNVVAILPGSDPVLKDQYIVLSGHLDHIGISPERAGDKPGKDRINNGALDNATGSAVTLEVARVFAEDARKPRRSLVFLLSTGEEKGLIGAGYYAANPTVPASGIVGDVDLDMPVILYPVTDLVGYGADHSTIGRDAVAALAPMKMTLAPDPIPQETIFVRSDHYRFVEKGVPAIFLETGFANGGKDRYEAFLADRYHKPNDEVLPDINWRAGARFAEANWRITTLMANADQRPMWYAGDYFGAIFDPDGPRAVK